MFFIYHADTANIGNTAFHHFTISQSSRFIFQYHAYNFTLSISFQVSYHFRSRRYVRIIDNTEYAATTFRELNRSHYFQYITSHWIFLIWAIDWLILISSHFIATTLTLILATSPLAMPLLMMPYIFRYLDIDTDRYWFLSSISHYITDIATLLTLYWLIFHFISYWPPRIEDIAFHYATDADWYWYIADYNTDTEGARGNTGLIHLITQRHYCIADIRYWQSLHKQISWGLQLRMCHIT